MDKPAENATDEVGEEEIAGGVGDKKKTLQDSVLVMTYCYYERL